jgi:hypothetical protein
VFVGAAVDADRSRSRDFPMSVAVPAGSGNWPGEDTTDGACPLPVVGGLSAAADGLESGTGSAGATRDKSAAIGAATDGVTGVAAEAAAASGLGGCNSAGAMPVCSSASTAGASIGGRGAAAFSFAAAGASR